MYDFNIILSCSPALYFLNSRAQLVPLVHRYSYSCWRVSHLKAGDSLGLVSVTTKVFRSFPADPLSQHVVVLLRLLPVLMVINVELELITVMNL